ncbi:MAG: hypothetical protein H8D67_19925 [Deltaproteobacteria bacterium]|nr:hypothetical protein [Deltaproteobacteria bacterium]
MKLAVSRTTQHIWFRIVSPKLLPSVATSDMLGTMLYVKHLKLEVSDDCVYAVNVHPLAIKKSESIYYPMNTHYFEMSAEMPKCKITVINRKGV